MSHRYRRGNVYWLAYWHNGKLSRESLKTKDLNAAKYLQNEKDKELLQNKSTVPNQNNLCHPVLKEYLQYHEHRGSKLGNMKTEQEIKDFLGWSNIQTFEQITEKQFQEYLNHKITSLKQPTLNRYIASIKAWLNYCVKMHYIFFNPLTYVKKYKLPENPKRFLSQEEIKKLLLTAKNSSIYVDGDTTLYPAIATGIYAGLRQRELFTLEWSNIDFKNNTISVINKVGFTTKSKKFRVIPLHSKLKSILESYKQKSGPCFDTTNWRRILRRIIKKAEIKDVGWHTLRHTFASHLVMNGVDIATVSKLLGHSNISTTMIYSHLSKDHLKGSVDKLHF